MSGSPLLQARPAPCHAAPPGCRQRGLLRLRLGHVGVDEDARRLRTGTPAAVAAAVQSPAAHGCEPDRRPSRGQHAADHDGDDSIPP